MRLIMLKADGSVLVHADAGGYKPLNWMTPPTTIEAVEQLTRYLDFIRLDPAKATCRGVLAAQTIKPQAQTLAESRGIGCVEVDLAVLRGEREPELTLFAT